MAERKRSTNKASQRKAAAQAKVTNAEEQASPKPPVEKPSRKERRVAEGYQEAAAAGVAIPPANKVKENISGKTPGNPVGGPLGERGTGTGRPRGRGAAPRAAAKATTIAEGRSRTQEFRDANADPVVTGIGVAKEYRDTINRLYREHLDQHAAMKAQFPNSAVIQAMEPMSINEFEKQWRENNTENTGSMADAIRKGRTQFQQPKTRKPNGSRAGKLVKRADGTYSPLRREEEITPPSGGNLVQTSDGTYSFTPGPNFTESGLLKSQWEQQSETSPQYTGFGNVAEMKRAEKALPLPVSDRHAALLQGMGKAITEFAQIRNKTSNKSTLDAAWGKVTSRAAAASQEESGVESPTRDQTRTTIKHFLHHLKKNDLPHDPSGKVTL